MYTVYAALWCSSASAQTLPRTPEEAGLAVEAGASVALLQFFKAIDVAHVVVEYRQLHLGKGYVVQIVFQSAEEHSTTLPDTLEMAERVVEERVSEVLRKVFGIECVARIQIVHVLRPAAWDEAVEDIA
jgi:hypothetical protein